MTSPLSPSEELAAMELLEDAFEASPGDPADYIHSRPNVEAAVRERALQLLAAARAERTPLRTGGAGAILGRGREDAAPERIGAYRLLRLLGRGGMGAVYLGERVDSDFDHVVAIKIIKPGIFSDSLVQRFRRERQILASLRHPHIAQLHDGGETAEGSPYIVMEYVDGISLSRWIEQERPSLEQRIALMLQICDAVAFAHQNLVIHRDLTPGNVLVNQRGEAKLIDFGIARPEEVEDQASSRLSKLSLTPGFSAPERSAGAAATTLMDVYSLGRLLAFVAEGIDAPELDAIAAKAAHDDPARRHASAALLARDIAGFRDGRPVSAYSTAPAYRMRKYVARHRLPVMLAGLAAFLLVGGFAGTTLAWRQAEHARGEAERRFGEVRELSGFLLFDLYDELQDVPGTTKALNDIADRARHYLDALSKTEGAPPEVTLEAALAYKRLADVLGTPLGANLGRREEAGEVLKIAVAQLRQLRTGRPEDRAIAGGLADALYSKAVFDFIALDDNQSAHEAAQEAARLYWQLARGKDREKFAARAIDAEIEAALPLAWIGKGKEAAASLEQTLARMERHIGEFGRTSANLALLARTQGGVAETLGRLADSGEAEYARALRHADRAVAIHEEHIGIADRKEAIRRSLAIALFKRALTLYSMDEEARALRDLDRSEAIIRGLMARDPEDDDLERVLNSVLEQKAITLAYDGQKARAVEVAHESLAAKRKRALALPDDPSVQREYAANLLLVGEVFEIAGRKAEACRTYGEGRNIFVRLERKQGLSDYDREVVAGDIAPAIARTC